MAIKSLGSFFPSKAPFPPTRFWRVLLGFALFFLLPAIIYPLIAPMRDISIMLPILAIEFFLAIPLLALALWPHFPLKRPPFAPLELLAIFLLIIGSGLLINAGGCYLLGELGHPCTLSQALVEAIPKLDPLSYGMAFIAVGLLAPLVEELLFRRLLQQWLKNYLSPLFAIIITSFFFSSLHFEMAMGLGNIPLIAALFSASFFFGLAYERSLRIVAPFLLHALHNILTLISA